MPGLPVSQGNLKPFTFKGKDGKVRAAMTEGTKGLKQWRADVRYTAINQGCGPMIEDAGVHLQVQFVLPRPKSAKKRNFPHVRPDLSKLIRAVEDALTGICYHDDAQICSILATKTYRTTEPSPGVMISVQRKR